MSQKLTVKYFWRIENSSQFTKDFMKNYNEGIDIGYVLKFNVKYPENLHKLHNDSSFLPERMSVKKLVCNLRDENRTCYSHKNFRTSTKLSISVRLSITILVGRNTLI